MPGLDTYVLDGHTPVPEPDRFKWTAWWSTADVKVAVSHFGDITVSTVFLGLDHDWSGKGRPLLFETMVFEGSRNGLYWRYATWEEAEAGHQEVFKLVSTPPAIHTGGHSDDD